MGKSHQNSLLSDATPKVENSFMAKRSEHYKNEYKTVQDLGKWNPNEW